MVNHQNQYHRSLIIDELARKKGGTESCWNCPPGAKMWREILKPFYAWPFNEKTSTSESLADDLSAPLKEAFNNLYGTTPQSDQRKNRSNNLRSKFSEWRREKAHSTSCIMWWLVTPLVEATSKKLYKRALPSRRTKGSYWKSSVVLRYSVYLWPNSVAWPWISRKSSVDKRRNDSIIRMAFWPKFEIASSHKSSPRSLSQQQHKLCWSGSISRGLLNETFACVRQIKLWSITIKEERSS